MKPNNNLPALGKGKEISNPGPIQHYSAPQYDIKDKVPWSPPMCEVLFSGRSSDQLCKLAEEAECLAAWMGLKHTLSLWKGCLWLESDCLATVHHLEDKCKNRSILCHTIEEVKEILKNYREVRIS